MIIMQNAYEIGTLYFMINHLVQVSQDNPNKLVPNRNTLKKNIGYLGKNFLTH